jgi:hypothetical protein
MGTAVLAGKGPADPVVDERGHGFVSGYCVSLWEANWVIR